MLSEWFERDKFEPTARFRFVRRAVLGKSIWRRHFAIERYEVVTVLQQVWKSNDGRERWQDMPLVTEFVYPDEGCDCDPVMT